MNYDDPRLLSALDHLQADFDRNFVIDEFGFRLIHAADGPVKTFQVPDPRDEREKQAIIEAARNSAKHIGLDMIGICFEARIQKLSPDAKKPTPGQMHEGNSQTAIVIIIESGKTYERLFCTGIYDTEKESFSWETWDKNALLGGIFDQRLFPPEAV